MQGGKPRDESASTRSDAWPRRGRQGSLYNVFRTPPGGPRELYGVACLTPSEAGQLGAITPDMVFEAMQRLTWPRSELVIQPPGGETLVNLETNFYTTNTGADDPDRHPARPASGDRGDARQLRLALGRRRRRRGECGDRWPGVAVPGPHRHPHLP